MSVFEKRRGDVRDLVAFYRKYKPDVRKVVTGLAAPDLTRIIPPNREGKWIYDGIELLPRRTA